LEAVILEEFGHFVDAQVNSVDSAGDEGNIFARLVQGESISESELVVLKAEDDTATIMLDGTLTQIEQNNTFYVTNNNNSGAGSLRQAIIDAGNTPGLDTIDLTRVNGTILLTSPILASFGFTLRDIAALTINAGNDIKLVDDGNSILNGQNLYSIMRVNGANVTIQGVTFSNGRAKGGNGFDGGGGGGLGAGGALFIDSGNVTLNNLKFLNNSAIGGNGGSLIANGGVQNNNSSFSGNYTNARDGGSGGSFQDRGGRGGAGGSAGGMEQRGWDGNPGDFGAGGGAGGGGGGGRPGALSDDAGNGGNGASGGFGAGGGAGGGGGVDYDEFDGRPENGIGGSGGSGGLYAGLGGNGQLRNSGTGGGGAGLGGAIFVNSGATLNFLNTVAFSGNSVAVGTGHQSGQGLGADVFFRDQPTSRMISVNGTSADDKLYLDPVSINFGSNSFSGYTFDAKEGNDTLYSVADIKGSSKSLSGGTGSDTFILNLKGETKLAFNFNTQKLADFVNALTIDQNQTGSGSDFVKELILDGVNIGLGGIPGKGTALSFLFSTGRTIGEYLTNSQSSQPEIEAQQQRARQAVSDFGTQNWGEIVEKGSRDTITIKDFQPGLDTIILPSLQGSTQGAYEYNVSSGSNGVEISVRINPSKIERFAVIENNYRGFGISDALFRDLILDLMVKDEEDRSTGTISTFKQTLVRSDNGNNIGLTH
jgi:hypothetical protein